jgi:hypothetical protein
VPRLNEAPQRYRRHWTVVLQFNQMNMRLKADKHLLGSRPPFKTIAPFRPTPRRLTALLMPHKAQPATLALAFSTEFGTSPA